MNDQFQSYFDAMPCYLTVQDRQLRMVHANQRFRSDFGETEGRHCYQVYKRRPEKCEVCPVERSFQDGHPHQSREEVTTLDGRTVAVLVNTTPIYDARGNISGVLEMSTDVTDMSRLEQQLRDSQERYRLLFEEVPCFISSQDRELRIVEANRLHRETFGTEYGCKCYKVYKHRDEACVPCVVKQTFDDGQVHIHEELVTSNDGRPINVMVTTAPMKNRNGEIDLVIEMSADITRLRELQSQLSSIGLIISSISHDLKGFLSGLDGGIYMVNSGLRRDDRGRIETGWEMVTRNVGHIRRTVLDILYFSKDRRPEPVETDVSDLVAAVVEQMQTRAKDHGVVITSEIDQSAGSFQVDPRAIRSLLTNLLDNALDACRLNTQQRDNVIMVSVGGDPDNVRIEISDNGLGMPQEVREKAFTLFFSSKGTGGTGLGLFIANKIAKTHGGRIDLDSEIGRGSRFTVTLPRIAAVTDDLESSDNGNGERETAIDETERRKIADDI